MCPAQRKPKRARGRSLSSTRDGAVAENRTRDTCLPSRCPEFDSRRPHHLLLMKAIFPWLFLAFFAQGTFGQGSGGVYLRASVDGRSWVIGNDLVERGIKFDPREGLSTTSWRHKVTGTDFMARASA